MSTKTLGLTPAAQEGVFNAFNDITNAPSQGVEVVVNAPAIGPRQP